MADEVDPQLQPILDMIEQTPNLEDVGVDAARRQFDAVADFTPDFDVHDQYDITIPGAAGDLDARVYQAQAGDQPVLAYFHGGGFVVGNIETHDNICQRLAQESGWTVVSVDYRLAPEAPFPASLEDAYAAVEWLTENPEEVGGDGTLAVGGDSAGANLSAGVSLMARDVERDVTTDETGPEIAHQVLFYPVAGSPFEEYESREENAEGYFLERDTMEWFQDQYVQSPVHLRNEYLAPLLADDLSGLPPAMVVTAGFDPLRDEGDALAEALAADGVDVRHERYDAMIHGFTSFLGLVDEADDSVRVAAEELERAG
ncbi:alpha/beta hydrolase [Natronomonas salina]|uniref:alpha/beta hydrolase n=1 Tax=Natronomonas salina TaxID=1710540 RepID=UPI0015B6E4BE|nr:alpha/beta hydrolase [Natronomonas salina]QLD89326.1 alpha/beta hydrolase [Natronomonas salina]